MKGDKVVIGRGCALYFLFFTTLQLDNCLLLPSKTTSLFENINQFYSLQIIQIIPITMAAVKRFFSSPRFAVAGASNDTHKFGYKSKGTRSLAFV